MYNTVQYIGAYTSDVQYSAVYVTDNVYYLGITTWLQGWSTRARDHKSQITRHYVLYPPIWLALLVISKHTYMYTCYYRDGEYIVHIVYIIPYSPCCRYTIQCSIYRCLYTTLIFGNWSNPKFWNLHTNFACWFLDFVHETLFECTHLAIQSLWQDCPSYSEM